MSITDLRKREGEELVLLREIMRETSAMLCGDVLREHETKLRILIRDYSEWKQNWKTKIDTN